MVIKQNTTASTASSANRFLGWKKRIKAVQTKRPMKNKTNDMI
jgi:hypothetical protein